jgi:fatty-acyl-CoA synthase
VTAPAIIRTLADIEAIEAVPLAERLDGIDNSYAALGRAASRYPDTTALVFLPDAHPTEGAVEISYRELFAGVTRAANLFHALGIGPGDVVSMLLPNLPETHYVIWGGEAAGVVNPINPLLEARQIADIMNAAQARVLVAAAPSVDGGATWRKAMAVREQVPTLRAVVPVGEGATDIPGVASFAALLAEQPGDRLLSGRRIRGDEIAAYFHTGGTTGTPKLACHTHFNEVANALMVNTTLDAGDHDIYLCGLPLFHVNSVIVSGLAPFVRGATVVLVSPEGYRDKRAIVNFWHIVQRYHATLFASVPTVLVGLLQVPPRDADLSSLRYAVCGAAPLPVEVMRNFEALTGLKVLEGYGLTEGTCVSAVNPSSGERRVGSIGLRLPYQEMKVVRLDDAGHWSRDCRPDEIGTLVIKGPNVIPGYRQENANRGLFVAEGWLNTGDLARQDSDGYFWLTGRQKELIIRGGHNIDPAIIENAMVQHPAVQIAAAVGKPDGYAGELPVAYVVLKPGMQATAAELLEHARRTVPERAAVPVEVFILDALPLTAVGKIFKPALRYQAIAHAMMQAVDSVAPGRVAAEVDVGPHDRYGTFARVRATERNPGARADAEQLIADKLGQLAIRYEVEWT